MTDLGYKRSNLEQYLYIKIENDLVIVIALYVDDFLFFQTIRKK